QFVGAKGWSTRGTMRAICAQSGAPDAIRTCDLCLRSKMASARLCKARQCTQRQSLKSVCKPRVFAAAPLLYDALRCPAKPSLRWHGYRRATIVGAGFVGGKMNFIRSSNGGFWSRKLENAFAFNRD